MHDARVARRDVRCGSARCLVVARQDLCGGKEQGRRPPLAAGPLCGSLVPCHHRGLDLPQPDILRCRSAHLVSPNDRPVSSRVRPAPPAQNVRPEKPVSSNVRPPPPAQNVRSERPVSSRVRPPPPPRMCNQRFLNKTRLPRETNRC